MHQDDSISEHIRNYMDVFGVTATFLANKLEIGRTTLYRKMDTGIWKDKEIEVLRTVPYFKNLFKKSRYAYLERESA